MSITLATIMWGDVCTNRFSQNAVLGWLPKSTRGLGVLAKTPARKLVPAEIWLYFPHSEFCTRAILHLHIEIGTPRWAFCAEYIKHDMTTNKTRSYRRYDRICNNPNDTIRATARLSPVRSEIMAIGHNDPKWPKMHQIHFWGPPKF